MSAFSFKCGFPALKYRLAQNQHSSVSPHREREHIHARTTKNLRRATQVWLSSCLQNLQRQHNKHPLPTSALLFFSCSGINHTCHFLPICGFPGKRGKKKKSEGLLPKWHGFLTWADFAVKCVFFPFCLEVNGRADTQPFPSMRTKERCLLETQRAKPACN